MSVFEMVLVLLTSVVRVRAALSSCCKRSMSDFSLEFSWWSSSFANLSSVHLATTSSSCLNLSRSDSIKSSLISYASRTFSRRRPYAVSCRMMLRNSFSNTLNLCDRLASSGESGWRSMSSSCSDTSTSMLSAFERNLFDSLCVLALIGSETQAHFEVFILELSLADLALLIAAAVSLLPVLLSFEPDIPLFFLLLYMYRLLLPAKVRADVGGVGLTAWLETLAARLALWAPSAAASARACSLAWNRLRMLVFTFATSLSFGVISASTFFSKISAGTLFSFKLMPGMMSFDLAIIRELCSASLE
mmetsp:Transcript_17442/g.31318  ORF Transcript_17442/g.31318 Transcript_17442/m.31318 type:complete len:304 (-) Transcript_17442:601-1512(-)